jgi:hypothetical protein
MQKVTIQFMDLLKMVILGEIFLQIYHFNKNHRKTLQRTQAHGFLNRVVPKIIVSQEIEYNVVIFKQTMGAKNRVGIGSSCRPARLHRLAN